MRKEPPSQISSLRYLKNNLFARIGVVTMLILLIALGSLFYYLTYKAVSANNKAKLITANLTAQSVLDKLDRNFYERFGDVQAFAFNKLAVETVMLDSVTPAAQEFINTMTQYYVLYDLMMICNRNGKVLVTNTVDKNGNPINSWEIANENFYNTDWFTTCLSSTGPEGGAWYSDFMANEYVSKMYGHEGYGMAFAAPIKDETGQVLGVWYNFASWADVTEGIREETELHVSNNDSGALIFIMRNNGEIISSSKKDLVIEKVKIDSVNLERKQNKPLYNGGLAVKDYVVGWGKSQGAYTFKGKDWKSATFIPMSTISWRIFFSRENFPVIAATLLVMIILGFILYTYIRKHIIHRIQFIQTVLERLSKGEAVEIQSSMQNGDEIGTMITKLHTLTETVKQKAAFADEIANGNFDAQLNMNKEDILANSLSNMRNQLRKANEEERLRSWTNEGLAKMAAILRSNTSTEDLYNQVVQFAIQYLKANQGGLFLFIKNNYESYFELVACYAYERKKYIQKRIEPGTGLVGQCALEGNTIYLTDIPSEYITISSGLGKAKPSSLILVPLKVNNEILGVMEIASIKSFKPYEIQFVEKIAESIASTISNVRINEHTRQLLFQAQQQTEEMRAQEEEMRQNMEELSATQEEMARKERGYVDKIQELEKKLENKGKEVAL